MSVLRCPMFPRPCRDCGQGAAKTLLGLPESKLPQQVEVERCHPSFTHPESAVVDSFTVTESSATTAAAVRAAAAQASHCAMSPVREVCH